MHRKWFVLLVLVLVPLASLACGGTGEGAAPAPQSDSPVETPVETSEATVPEELKDIAVISMSTGRVIHKSKHYVMSAQGISQSVLDARAACFSALAQGTESPPCTALQKDEYSRMPASCSNAGGQATKDGYCPR